MAVSHSALVTGASRGIGLGIATRLAEQGYDLTITSRRQERLDEVASRLLALGAHGVEQIAAEISNEDEIARVIDAHSARFGGMSALVLAAGVGSAGPIADYPLSRWDRQFAVNVRSAFFVIRQALPMLRKSAQDDPCGARIIALGSIGGVYAEPNLAAYGAAKAALVSLCHSVNAEESAAGVSATAIAPAYVDTDMSAWVREQVPAESMISVNDIVTLVVGILGLSARAVVSEIVVGRAGTSGYCA